MVGLVLIPARHQIEKLPFSQISQSKSGYRPTAAVVGLHPERPLWPTCCRWPGTLCDRFTLKTADEPRTA